MSNRSDRRAARERAKVDQHKADVRAGEAKRKARMAALVRIEQERLAAKRREEAHRAAILAEKAHRDMRGEEKGGN